MRERLRNPRPCHAIPSLLLLLLLLLVPCSSSSVPGEMDLELDSLLAELSSEGSAQAASASASGAEGGAAPALGEPNAVRRLFRDSALGWTHVRWNNDTALDDDDKKMEDLIAWVKAAGGRLRYVLLRRASSSDERGELVGREGGRGTRGGSSTAEGKSWLA